MISFLVNGIQVPLLGKLPDTITSLVIQIPPMPFRINSKQVAPLKEWLNEVVSKITNEFIEYQGALIPTEDLVKFTDV